MGTITGATAFDTLGVAPGARWLATNAIFASEDYDNAVIAGFEWIADPDGNPATHGRRARRGAQQLGRASRKSAAMSRATAAGGTSSTTARRRAWSSPGRPATRGPRPGRCALPATGPRRRPVVSASGPRPRKRPTWSAISRPAVRRPAAAPYAIKPEVMAPGDDIYSTFPGGGYAYMSGTSMAGPHVAGVVALMREAAPDLDVTAIKEILMATAVDLGTPGRGQRLRSRPGRRLCGGESGHEQHRNRRRDRARRLDGSAGGRRRGARPARDDAARHRG